MSGALPARPGGGGRIVLDSFRSTHDPLLRAWMHFRAQIVTDDELTIPLAPAGDDAQASTGGVYGVWRILATNNRELGRCGTLHTTPGDAVRDAVATQAQSASLSAVVVRGVRPMTHGWLLRRDGHIALTASRWYESSSEARVAAKAAQRALASAVLVGGVSVGTQSGRRHRRAIAGVEPRG